jgi:DNA-binding PadR family transcriptional regulator
MSRQASTKQGRAHGHGAGRDAGKARERGRLRHGEVRGALLLALVDGPAHGYELGQRLLRASGGAWQPSPGSIYPTLSVLADDGAVRSEERDGKRIFTLTKRGEAEVHERSRRGEPPPWSEAFDRNTGALREAVVQLKLAAKQISAVGNAQHREAAIAVVNEARARLYELLAKG